MKKLLALVLALVMSMSLVTISNAAFDDADEISYKEAVDVMVGVGVLAGYDNGDFGPTDTLTRAQACKIIAYLDLGGKTADAIKGSGAVFTDVAATAWYAGYVEYCAGAGYVAGVGDGKFDPDAKVTATQFAKMLLCALGYSAEIEGYTGADYTLAIARDANKNDLFDELSIVTSAALTREQAAQMALNALQADVVEYEGGTKVSTADGTVVTVNAIRDTVKPGKDVEYDGNDDGIEQLCEKLYGKDISYKAGEDDDFGRATKTWKYDGEEISTVADEADIVYTAKMTSSSAKKEIKADLKAEGLTGSVLTAAVDTVSDKTGNGKIVEIYIDDSDKDNVKIDTIIELEFTAAKVDDITVKSKYTQYTLKDSMGTTIVDGTYKLYNEDQDDTDQIVLNTKVAEDDIVLAIKAPNGDKQLFVYGTTNVTGTQTAYKDGKITVSGSTYTLAKNANTSEFVNSDDNAVYYFDQYGYVVYVDDVSSTTEYVIVDKIALTSGLSETASAKVVFMDGSAKEVKVSEIGGTDIDELSPAISATASDNAANYANIIYSYEIDDDGNYELTKVGAKSSATGVVKGEAKLLAANTYADAETVFIVKDNDGDFTAYTGYNAVPSVTGASTVYYRANSSNVVETVYIDASSATIDDSGKASQYVYILDDDVTVSGTKTKLYTYKAFIDGEETDVTFKGDTFAAMSTGLYKVKTVNDDGYITKTEASGFTTATVAGDTKNGILKLTVGGTTTAYSFDDETAVVFVDDDSAYTGSLSSVKEDDTVAVYFKLDTDVATYYIETAYVVLVVD